ncbi:hypothetical protein GGS26DRAFT_591855 [Hypomontagnella submonticulosa]|nr:hypothetical protein GGS26DRAFT_591855 [Hypomontagnella submonticulosa]
MTFAFPTQGPKTNGKDGVIIRNDRNFSEFGPRALLFAHSTLWHDARLEDISIERMQGGECNDIFGLTRRENTATGSRGVRYILRVPAFRNARVDRDVAALEFVGQHTQIPVPEVISFDDTIHNSLGCPFQIQSRIEGTNFHTAFPDLDHAARSKIAHELGGVFRQMLDTRSNTAGLPAFLSEIQNAHVPLYIEKFGTNDVQLTALDSPTTETILEHFYTNFESQKDYELEVNPEDSRIPRFMDQFCDMVEELDERGYFKDVSHCLAHLDFSSYNVLIHQTSDPQQPIVSGIVDWDSADLAPAFMACKPPFWIWRGIEDELENERFDHDEPLTPEARQLKDIFDEAAGPEYRRFAYEPVYRLVRRLMYFVSDGRMDGEDFLEANVMLREWRHMRST